MVTSNWGRWGENDERGAVNLLTPEHVRRACSATTQGITYELGILLKHDSPAVGRRISPQHLMAVDGGDYAALGRDEGSGAADDYLFMAVHGSSHIDALSHVWQDGQMYNGHSFKDVRSSGAARCGIEKTGGIVTVGHVFDFESQLLSADRRIGPDDFAKQASDKGMDIQPGDAILVHTGWMRRTERGEPTEDCPTVSPDAADWLADQDICLIGADNPAVEDVDDLPLRLHPAMLRDRGVYLLELLSLAQPAADGVVSGMLVVAPLRISRGVGSPVNPLLVV